MRTFINIFRYIRSENNNIKYKKAISLNPLDSDFYRNIGIAYVETGEISKAKEILIDLKKINPDKAKQLEFFLAGTKKK